MLLFDQEHLVTRLDIEQAFDLEMDVVDLEIRCVPGRTCRPDIVQRGLFIDDGKMCGCDLVGNRLFQATAIATNQRLRSCSLHFIG